MSQVATRELIATFMPEIDQTAQGVLFGSDLRALRTRIPGLSQVEVARRVGTSHATVCRLERGRRLGPEAVLRGMLRLYGVDPKGVEDFTQRAKQARNPGWFADHKGAVPDWFRRYLALEAEALHKDSYESEFVPGLLQIPDYTAAVAAACRVCGPSDSAESVLAVLSTRYRRLLDNDTPLGLTAVLNEAVIRRVVGGRHVMRQQLAYLVEIAARPNVALHILPFAAQEHPAMTGAFTLLRFSQETINTVYMEQADGAVYVDRPQDVCHYQTIFENLVHLALGEAGTMEMLERAEREM